MSSFYCPECYAHCEDTDRGYVSWCSHNPRESGDSPERGVLYFLSAGGKRGGKHAVQLAVSLWSLRESGAWTGPVHLMTADDAASEVGEHLKKADPLLTTQDVRYDQKKMRCYSAKTFADDWSPFKRTIYLDCDTIVRGDIKELWPLGEEMVFTHYCNWRAADPKSKIINGRIAKWEPHAPLLVRKALTVPRPAINTGAFGFARDTAFFEHWRGLCAVAPKMFLGDETAAQVLIANFDDWRIVDSRWNRSPHFEQITEDTRVIHHHGSKAMTQRNSPHFLPYWTQVYRQNFAGVRSWALPLWPELSEVMKLSVLREEAVPS